jgi:hypothetical protein|tara:strand:+ start:146 stop:271 length:126 start_codon:yes stop_codon:yes gene_type:complete
MHRSDVAAIKELLKPTGIHDAGAIQFILGELPASIDKSPKK